MSVEATNLDGMTLNLVGTVYQGPPGINGGDGQSAYQLWLSMGNTGTAAQFIESLRGPAGNDGKDGKDGTNGTGTGTGPGQTGADGREIELSTTTTHIVWRYVGDAGWFNLLAKEDLRGRDGIIGVDGKSAYQLAVDAGFVGTQDAWLQSLKGAVGLSGKDGLNGTDGLNGSDGVDGKSVELQKSATHVQWRLLGDTAWTNLIALTDLKGSAGTGLTNRGNWAAATYNPGDYVFSVGSSGTTSMWILNSATAYVSSVQPLSDSTNWIEFEAPAGANGTDGADGIDGKSAYEIAVAAGYVGTEAEWLASLKGADGTNGIDGTNGADGLNGADGIDGADGALWHVGSGAPTGATGADNDMYFDLASGDVYGPKAAGAWGAAVANIKGPPGADGADGSSGGAAYTLPTASATVLGGVKVGTGLAISADGVLSASGGESGGSTGGASNITSAVLTADFINQTTTVQEFVNLGALEAGVVYRFRFMGIIRPTDLAVGIQIALTGSFGAQMIQLIANYRGQNGTPISLVVNNKANPFVLSSHEFGNEGNLLVIEGLIHNQSAGTLGMGAAVMTQWAYCPVLKGSFVLIEKIGAVAI